MSEKPDRPQVEVSDGLAGVTNVPQGTEDTGTYEWQMQGRGGWAPVPGSEEGYPHIGLEEELQGVKKVRVRNWSMDDNFARETASPWTVVRIDGKRSFGH